MKTYQVQISYQYVSNIGNGKKIDRTDTWTDKQKYPTKKQAQTALEEYVTNISKQYKVHYSKVIESEQNDTMVMEGTVSDNGLEYGDYALTLEDEQGPGYSKLIESIIGSNYYGRKVRITVELLPE